MAESLDAVLAGISDLIEQEVSAICKRYRADPDQTRRALYAAIARQPGLLAEVQTRGSPEEVARLGAYKAAVKAARKAVYYQLRRYRRQDDASLEALTAQLAAQIAGGAPAEAIRETRRALLGTHASTRERDQQAFFRALFAWVEPPASVVDVGCGLQPLAYPFAEKGCALYVAVDRDAQAIQILETFASMASPARLVALRADLAGFDWAQVCTYGVARFDLALMLKLVPVVSRQQRDLLPLLAGAPARRVLVTGNMESLARRETIRRREDRALRGFIEMSGRRVIGHFEAPGEFGYVLE